MEIWLNAAILAEIAQAITFKYAQAVLDQLPLLVDNASNVLIRMLLNALITKLSRQSAVRAM